MLKTIPRIKITCQHFICIILDGDAKTGIPLRTSLIFSNTSSPNKIDSSSFASTTTSPQGCTIKNDLQTHYSNPFLLYYTQQHNIDFQLLLLAIANANVLNELMAIQLQQIILLPFSSMDTHPLWKTNVITNCSSAFNII